MLPVPSWPPEARDGRLRRKRLGASPQVEPEQFSPERRECGCRAVQLLDPPRVSGERLAAWRSALSPLLDPLLARRCVVLARRLHRNVLREPWAFRGVAPVAVRKELIPDDEITCFARDRLDVETGEIGSERVAVVRLRPDPGVQVPVHPRNALEATLLDRGILEIEDPLHAEREREARGIHVPVDEPGPIELRPVRARGGVQADAYRW